MNSVVPALLQGVASQVPVDIDRDAAAEAARRELSKAIYTSQQTAWWVRLIDWVKDRLSGALDATGLSVAGLLTLVLLGLALVALAVFVVRRAGPLRGSARSPAGTLFAGSALSAQEHRRRADEAAAQGRWRDCALERFRAVVRSLEERGLIDPQPGRTAAEAAAAAGRVLPECAADLGAGAHLFDEIAYGTLVATSEHSVRLALLDDRVRSSRGAALSASGWAGP